MFNQVPPVSILLYTDRDCCSLGGPSKLNQLLHQLEVSNSPGSIFYCYHFVQVRLSIWHFMRRLPTTALPSLIHCMKLSWPSCPPTYSSRIKRPMYEGKMARLLHAGMRDPSGKAVCKPILKKELSHHCRQCAQGGGEDTETKRLLGEDAKCKTDYCCRGRRSMSITS